ncbi:MAG TPA: serine hydrolase domain-containing protein [Gemmatimonadales bacterium]|nr:serine hydrolase domain-containing protein [Gemmatimonadales bacterium]
MFALFSLALALTQAPGSTASGRHLAALVEAINTRDSSAIIRFGREHYSASALAASGGEARLLERWLEIGTNYGLLELDSVLATTTVETTAWARGKISKAWLSFRLLGDSAEPHRVIRIGLGRGLRPPYADARAPVLTGAALVSHIEDYLRRLAGEDLFSGVVLIVRNGRPVISSTYGFADQARRTAFRMDTPFDIASTAKLFTAVAIGQLAERGALRLTDTIGKYIPELPPPLGRRITIAQLLEHSSGLGELGPRLDSVMQRAVRVADMVGLLHDTTLAFPPGTSVLYSNRGYVLLGAVVERAGGRPYADYVRQEIFLPAGMTRTGLLQAAELPGDRARRYTRYPALRSGWTPGPRVEFSPEQDLAPGPHGGASSTAEDLVRFAAALTGGRLVSAAMLKQMTEPQRGTGRSLGFQIGGGGVSAYFGHGGGAPGMNSMLRVFPGLGYTVVILSNYDSGANLAGAYITEVLR